MKRQINGSFFFCESKHDAFLSLSFQSLSQNRSIFKPTLCLLPENQAERKETTLPRPAFVSDCLKCCEWSFFCFSLERAQIERYSFKSLCMKASFTRKLLHIEIIAKGSFWKTSPLVTRLLWFSALPLLNKLFFFFSEHIFAVFGCTTKSDTLIHKKGPKTYESHPSSFEIIVPFLSLWFSQISP